MAKHDVISKDHEEAIKAAFLAGKTTREVAIEFGLHARSAAKRKQVLVKSGADFGNCACGKHRLHAGMCSARWAHFKAQPVPKERRHFERVRTDPTYAYPGLPMEFRQQSLSPERIMMAVESCIPKRLPRDVREEVCAEMLLAHVSGDLAIEDFGTQAREYVIKVYGMFPIHGAPLSLDALFDETSGRALHDTLSTSIWDL